MQMPKNGLVLVPLMFSVNIWYSPEDPGGMANIVISALAAAAIFAACSAAVYLLNDLADRNRDKQHPVKRNRPIASGALPTRVACLSALILIAAAITATLLIDVLLLSILALYLAINVAYTLLLKQVVLLDVMSVASGFVLRALSGVIAIDGMTIVENGVTTPIEISVSPWFYVVTALGATLLALVKRRAELLAAGDNAAEQRAILQAYPLQFLDILIGIAATCTLMSYTLYTFSFGDSGANVPSGNSMMLTIPFVAYGIFRYLHLLYVQGEGEAPEEILLKDMPTILNVMLWLAVSASVLLWHGMNS